MKRTFRGLVGAIALSAAIGAPTLANDPADAALAFIVHGLPGDATNVENPVDILVDDTLCALPGLAFGEVFGPMPVEPRSYNFKISPANAETPCGNEAVLVADILFEEGESASVVAYFDEVAEAVVEKFTNDVSPVRSGTARLILHHLAATGAADIAFVRPVDEAEDEEAEEDEEPEGEESAKRGNPNKPDRPNGPKAPVMIEGIANGDQVGVVLRPGDWNVVVYEAGATEPATEPVAVKIRPFSVRLVYVVGSPVDGTLTVIDETVVWRRHPRRHRPTDEEEPEGDEPDGPAGLMRDK